MDDWSQVRTKRSVGGTQVDEEVTGLLLHHLRLDVISGPDEGISVLLEGPTARIGIAESNDLVLTDDTVSRFHAEVTVRNGRYVLRDLGSTNGTMVNGVLVMEAVIGRGMRLLLGETELVFQSDASFLPVSASTNDSFGELYGTSQDMRRVFGLLERVAPTNLTCLIVGETGTGKELAARAIHEASLRREAPFVVVDCGSLHPALIESELFGHERGAFTGAAKERSGAFELAQGGTVFLDEIGELPLDLQPRLLRVIERREVKRVGATGETAVDVRILAATHRDLESMVASGTFRQDLFFRLAETIAILPPLRARRMDIRVLVERMLGAIGGERRGLTREALAFLEGEPWPGNVRELRNTLRRAVALSDQEVLDTSELLKARPLAPRRIAETSSREALPLDDDLPLKEARERWVSAMERRYLEAVLARFGDDLEAAAAHIGVHPKTIYRLLRQRGLSTPGRRE